MELHSVNRSRPRPLDLPGGTVVTGIAKEPVPGPVPVRVEGLEGDGVGDTDHHGGLDQAVYLYGLDDYRWWREDQGLEIHPGLFGENLTVTDLSTADLEVGDRLRGRAVELEVTGPRIPCATLAGRVGVADFARRFTRARRPGAYARVLVEGDVTRGDGLELVPGRSGVTLLDCVDAYHDVDTAGAQLRRLLATPLASRLRHRFERRLDRIPS